MRLGWLVALAASVALMVGAFATHSANQKERRGDRDEGLGAVSALSAAHVDAELERVAAVLVASPENRPVDDIATQLGQDVNLCAAGDASATLDCAATGPRADTELERMVTDSARRTDGVVFATTEGDATDDVVVAALATADRILIAHIATRRLLAADSTLIPDRPFNTPRLVDASVADVDIGPSSRGERRVFTVPVGSPFVDGDRYVVASASATVSVSNDQRWSLLVSLVVGALLFVVSTSALVTQHRRLSRHAATDDLTGLVTRREFERLGRRVLDDARREHAPAAVIFIDLNGFKAVNDQAGHQVGDAVLKAVAAHLSAIVRDSDVIARWGGDEFAMLLPGAGAVAAGRRGTEIEAALEQVTTEAGRAVSASVGAAVFPAHGDDLGALVHSADTAMYHAKRDGRAFGMASPATR